jgi:DNA-binding CsgD family transcriptional regulator
MQRLPNYDLTIREHQVFKALCEGLNYKELSKKFVLSETTIKTHINNIFSKLQVNDRTQAVIYGIKNGYVTTPIKACLGNCDLSKKELIGKLESFIKELEEA